MLSALHNLDIIDYRRGIYNTGAGRQVSGNGLWMLWELTCSSPNVGRAMPFPQHMEEWSKPCVC
jgi:hypothetical protein